MACTRREENRKFVFSLNTETVNRHIVQPGIRVRSVTHAKRDVRACVIRRVGRCRDEAVQIKIGIRRQMHNLLTRRRTLKFHWCNRLFHAVIQHFPKILRLTVQKCSHTLPARQDTDRNTCVRVAFDIAENHCRSFFRRTFYRSARADIAVNSGKLRHRINCNIRLGKLSRHIFQSFQRTAQISYFFSHNHSPYSPNQNYLIECSFLYSIQPANPSDPLHPLSLLHVLSFFILKRNLCGINSICGTIVSRME